MVRERRESRDILWCERGEIDKQADSLKDTLITLTDTYRSFCARLHVGHLCSRICNNPTEYY